MDTWFWYAERDEETKFTKCADGIVHANSATEAYDKAAIEARKALNNTYDFTIKQFNKVS